MADAEAGEEAAMSYTLSQRCSTRYADCLVVFAVYDRDSGNSAVPESTDDSLRCSL